MPTYDRYWRLGVAALLLLAAGGAGIIVWYVLTGQPLERLFGPGITYSNTCQVVWAVMVLCVVVPHLMDARKRDRARVAALRGNLDAMPPSRIVTGDTATAATTAELLTARGVVSADEVGLHFRRAYRRRRTTSVPWGEARLLEVWLSGSGRQRVRGFTLYGERTKIEWSLPRGRQARTQKQSDIEAALLAAIHAHAGLSPRTFAPALQRRPAARPAGRAGPKPLGTILTVVIMLLPFAVAAAALLLPLTTEPGLNAYVACSFGVLGLVVVVVAVQAQAELFHRAPLPDPAMILPLGVLPPNTSGTGTYILRWRARPLTRLGEAALGLLFAGNIVPLIGILFGAETAAASAWTDILNFTVGGAVLLGVLMLWDAAFSGRHTITADATGLRAGRQTLRWADIEDVVARVPGNTVAGFKVVGADGDVTIEWPTRVHTTPRRGAQTVTPSELAALVVARSGTALRVEGD